MGYERESDVTYNNLTIYFSNILKSFYSLISSWR